MTKPNEFCAVEENESVPKFACSLCIKGFRKIGVWCTPLVDLTWNNPATA